MENNKQKKNKKLRGRSYVLIIVGIIATVSAIVFIVRTNKISARLKTLSFEETENLTYTGNAFISSNDNKFFFYDIKNNKNNYSTEVNAEDANIAGAENINLIYNKWGLNIIGTRDTHEFDGEIINVKCGGSFAAVYYKNGNGENSIIVYNSAGQEILSKEFKDTVLTDFGFESYNSPFLWTVELMTAGNSTSTTITTYDLSKGSNTGVLSIQGQLVKNIFFTEKSIFVFCTKNMIRFDRKTNKEVYNILTYGYDCNSYSFTKKGSVLFVLENENGNAKYVRLLVVSEKDVANESSRIVQLPDTMLCFASMAGNLTVVTENGILRYDTSGKIIRETYFKDIKIDAKILDDKRIIVYNGFEYTLCTLVEKLLPF